MIDTETWSLIDDLIRDGQPVASPRRVLVELQAALWRHADQHGISRASIATAAARYERQRQQHDDQIIEQENT